MEEQPKENEVKVQEPIIVAGHEFASWEEANAALQEVIEERSSGRKDIYG